MAPIQADGSIILDIGTGTGRWAIQMGELYNGARITGNDLSPIQPSWVPNNVNFLVDDVELDWTDADKFDIIHCKCMGSAIEDWPRLIGQIHKALKPGGWVEFTQLSTEYTVNDQPLAKIYPTHAFLELSCSLKEACSLTGRMFDPTPYLEQWILQEGFKGLERRDFKMPIGTWPTDERESRVGEKMRKICHRRGACLDRGVVGRCTALEGRGGGVVEHEREKRGEEHLEVMQGLVTIWAQKCA